MIAFLQARLLWAAAALGLLVMVGGFGYVKGHAAGAAVGTAKVAALTAQYAETQAKAESAAWIKQESLHTRIAAIDAQHAQELRDAQAKSDAVVADLRAGTLRLRRQWRGCEAAAGVPSATAGASQPDATADVRAASEEALFRAIATDIKLHAEADAQIRALQSVVKADRQ